MERGSQGSNGGFGSIGDEKSCLHSRQLSPGADIRGLSPKRSSHLLGVAGGETPGHRGHAEGVVTSCFTLIHTCSALPSGFGWQVRVAVNGAPSEQSLYWTAPCGERMANYR